MERGVRVFHISDLHMRGADGPQAERARLEAASRWRVLGKPWEDNLAELRRDGVPFDLVVFTGDLGDWGHRTDYPGAIAFLRQTCAALDVPLERLFVVPGNHDVDRTIQRTAWESMRSEIGKDPRAYSRWMAGDDRGPLGGDGRRDQILERQRAFWGAVEAELGPALGPRRSPHGRLGYRRAVALPGLAQPIHVIGLDTAWLAGDQHDGGELRLTEHQVALLTTTEGGAPLPGFRLALMHHRIADLADADDSRKLLADRVDLLLHGHQHEPAADVLLGPDRELLVLATGCLYEGDAEHRYANTCQVIDLVLDERARPRRAAVRLRGWSERNYFWGDDALLYRSARGGQLWLGRGERGWRFDEPRAETPPPPLQPHAGLIDFTTERQQHSLFVGREDVLARLDEWLLGPDETGWVVVTSGPGMGKSAILSAWLARREDAGAVVPHHFVRRQVADWDQPETIAASLVGQIEAAFPDLRDPTAKPERRLIELLGRVSAQLSPAGRLVVVVDGLDETRTEPDDNPLPRFLPHVIPAGIRFLCATRPTYPHLSWIEARNPVRRLDLDDGRWAASNEAVVREFWTTVGARYRPPLSAEAMAVAIARAEGNVLHAVMLHDAWRDSADRRADLIPRGLKGLIGEIWDRAASRESVRVGLGLLCAAQEALPYDVLAALAGWSFEDKERFGRDARQLLLEEPASWSGVEAYRPRHEWVRELIGYRLGETTLRAHHATLARELAPWPPPAEAIRRRYALRHALIHRAEAGDWADAWRVAADMRFLEAKCRELGAHEAEADVARAAERCRMSGDSLHGRRFGDLARALARESHWLRAAPEAAAALVWNRLRRSGWRAEELDEQLGTLAGPSFLRIRHAATRESSALVRDLVGHVDSVNACAVTADGRRVVSVSCDRTLKVWDLESGRVLATLEGHADMVRACAVTPDGSRAVSASDDRTLKVWDLERGRVLATLEGHADVVRACAVTPDGRRVISASDDRTLKVWGLPSGDALATLEGHADWVRACAVTPDGRRVISGSADGTLKIWDPETGRALATLEGHSLGVRACAVTPDGRQVVSASGDGTLKVWELETGRALATLRGHADGVRACAVAAGVRRVVSASDDRTLRVWDLDGGRVLATLQGHADGVRACAVTADGRCVISASDDGPLKVWDAGGEHARATAEGHAGSVHACAVAADAGRAVSASADGTLKLWDTSSGRTLDTLPGHVGGTSACAVTADGRRVVSVSGNGVLKVWDLERGTARTLPGHAERVVCAMTPHGWRLVTASREEGLRVWDLEAGRALTDLHGHVGLVRTCAVTADGRRVIAVSGDGTLKLWDLESGHARTALYSRVGPVRACAVTADGRRAVVGSSDGTLTIWDLERGRALATLEGHAGFVSACAVTEDGRRAISASVDRMLKVWDLDTHACLFTHRGEIAYTTVAATASVIVAGDHAGAVWFLEWPRGAP